MPNVRINITLPANFLEELDKKAQQELVSRSAYIRLALLQKMDVQNMTDLRPYDEQRDPDQEWQDKLDKIKEIYGS